MRHATKQFRFFSHPVLGMLILLMVAAITVPTAAQEATPSADSAQLHLGHFVFDAPTVNLYIDDAVVTAYDGSPMLFYSMTLPTSEYLNLTAGVHTFALVPEGGTLDTPLVADQRFTLEAGRQYMLAFLGNVSAKDLHVALIDETAAIAAHDLTHSAVTLFVNNLTGVPAIDVQFNGQPYVTNLAYGDYVVYQDPTEGTHSFVIAHGDPTAVILDNPEATGGPAHFFAAFVFAGRFSGTLWDGYTALYTGQVDHLAVTNGGTIAVGDSLPVTFTEIGQRVRYTLTLNAPAVLDITEVGQSGQDAFLRMYDSAGNLVRENDELSMDDNANNIFDAGWQGLSLKAGTYILEAATWVDTGTGTFKLSVSAAH